MICVTVGRSLSQSLDIPPLSGANRGKSGVTSMGGNQADWIEPTGQASHAHLKSQRKLSDQLADMRPDCFIPALAGNSTTTSAECSVRARYPCVGEEQVDKARHAAASAGSPRPCGGPPSACVSPIAPCYYTGVGGGKCCACPPTPFCARPSRRGRDYLDGHRLARVGLGTIPG